jgi:hypothetical protein
MCGVLLVIGLAEPELSVPATAFLGLSGAVPWSYAAAQPSGVDFHDQPVPRKPLPFLHQRVAQSLVQTQTQFHVHLLTAAMPLLPFG